MVSGGCECVSDVVRDALHETPERSSLTPHTTRIYRP